jgi:hypothetical protein
MGKRESVEQTEKSGTDGIGMPCPPFSVISVIFRLFRTLSSQFAKRRLMMSSVYLRIALLL